MEKKTIQLDANKKEATLKLPLYLRVHSYIFDNYHDQLSDYNI